jgi:hypothetical protein
MCCTSTLHLRRASPDGSIERRRASTLRILATAARRADVVQ